MIEAILQRVTRLPLSSRWPAHQARLGQHQSRQRGAGLAFDQLKEYQPGDTVRHINWAAMARRGSTVPLVNAYYEEKDLTVMLLVDMSASMAFGSTRLTKQTLAAEICASLVYSALSTHDRVGLLGFAAEVVCYLPPRQSQRYLRAIPERLLQRPTDNGPASFWTAVTSLERWVRRSTLVFLLSDFLTDDFSGLFQALTRLRQRHDAIALVLTDPLEMALPVGRARLVARDLESGKVRAYSLTGAHQQSMMAHHLRRQSHLQQIFRQLRLPHLTVTPHSNYHDELRQLLLGGHRRASP